MTETSKQVDNQIGEAFRLVLTPHREPGTSEIIWHTTRADSNGPLVERITKKLATDEKLIQRYGGVRLRMEIDRYTLWTDRHDVTVRDLWKLYAQFPHMPRLAGRQTLYDAISDGTANLAWSTETFAYAAAHDGTRWVGLTTGSHVSADPSGLLVDPAFLPGTSDGEPTGGGGTGDSGVGEINGGPKKDGGGADDVVPAETKFYAMFDLDPVRGIKQLGDIFDHIAAHLGPNVTMSLELRAENPAGYTDATRRVVSENANNLGARAQEFE